MPEDAQVHRNMQLILMQPNNFFYGCKWMDFQTDVSTTTGQQQKKLNSLVYFMCTGWYFPCYLGPQ